MPLKVYGASDDLIEIEGDFREEDGCYACLDDEHDPHYLIFSDGTILTIIYGKDIGGIWEIKLISKGSLFDRIDVCLDDEADIYSDIAYFKDGIKFVYHSLEGRMLK